jgi:hypothetical protein
VVPEPSLRDDIVAASSDRHGTPVPEIDVALEAALGKSSVSTKPLGEEVVQS